jgi:hypothetical protein
MSQITYQSIEEKADKDGKGSVWRACLAVQRSSKNKELGEAVLKLGYGYCLGKKSNIQKLNKVVNILFDNSSEEFREALRALRNAIIISNRQS